MQKKLQFKITKKRMNVANFINISINVYTYIACDEKDSK